MCVYIITILYGTETPVEIGDHIHPGTHRKTSECKLGLSIQLIHTSMCHVRRWYCFLFSWQVSFPQESSLTWSLRLKTRFWVLKEEEKEREGARKMFTAPSRTLKMRLWVALFQNCLIETPEIIHEISDGSSHIQKKNSNLTNNVNKTYSL